MKVYCDRLATVIQNEAGQIECPKCNGVCNKDIRTNMFDCTRCFRGWQQVPETITTEKEAEDFLESLT